MPTLADLLFRTVDGVFAVDAKQRVIFWNPGCAQLFGTPSKQALGRPCSEVVRGKDPEGQPFCGGGCCVARLTTHGGNAPRAFPLQVCNNKGEDISLKVSIILVPSRQKNLWTCLHLLHRGDAADALDLLEYNGPQKSSLKQRNGDGVGRPDLADVHSLSAREQELLQLLSEGLSVPVISQLLNISPVTVRNHLQHIQKKLGVHSQVETVAYAYRHNLV